MSMKELANARKQFNKFEMECIVPNKEGILCKKKPIRSHAIQHNGILSCLAENGIVYCLGEKTKGEEFFEYDLKNKGISREASVFKCVCKEHDDLLFADIEKRLFCKEPKQCFQYALKALLHSYWIKCNDVSVIEKIEIDIPSTKEVRKDQIAYEEEQNCFWEIYHTECYHELLTHIVTIDREIGFAVSSSINILRKFDGTLFGNENVNYPLLHISAFPTEGKSYLLISALKKNETYFKAFTHQFIKFSVDDVLKRFNIIFPLLIDNIYISPRVVDEMTSKERKELLAIFNIKGIILYNDRGIDVNKWAEQVSYNIWE